MRTLMMNLKEDHAAEKEKWINDLMQTRKNLENTERALQSASMECRQMLHERELNRDEVDAKTLEVKKLKDELQLAIQGEKLAASKFEKYTKEYSEMKSKFEIGKEEKLQLEELERVRTTELRKCEVRTNGSCWLAFRTLLSRRRSGH